MLGIGLGWPAAALAHGGGPDTANYLSTVTSGDVPGVEWRVLDDDAQLEVVNRSDEVIVVSGYDGEPYLRLSPEGTVEENRRSPAATRNDTRFDDLPVPASADSTAPPEWVTIDDDHQHSWYDHRIHWMSSDRPTIVTDPTVETTVFNWTVSYLLGDTDPQALQVQGILRWTPDVSWRVPLLTTIAAFAAVAISAVVLTRPSSGSWTRLARPVGTLVVLVLVANFVRVIDDLAAGDGSIGEHLVVLLLSAFGVVVIGYVVAASWHGEGLWFLAIAAAGVFSLLLYGGESFGELTSPNLDTGLPSWVRRWTVAASFAIAVPTTIAAIAGAVAHARHLHRLDDRTSRTTS